jgi:lysophospholipase L1-like esterase
VRKLALFLPLLCIAALPAEPATTAPVDKKTTKPVKKKVTGKVTHKKHPRVPVVAVSPQVRHVAFQAVSARATHPMSTLDGAGALVPFFEQISRPSETSSLHILHYGDSHTASDDWAAEMRQSLQAKFGAGGPGFTLAGHPFAGYRRFDSKGNNSRGWYTDGLVGRQGDGIYGLSGVSLTAQSAGQTVSLVAECEQLELHYLQQPGGGQLEFTVDGVPSGTIDTADDLGPGIYRYVPSPGSHEYVVTTSSSAPVRLFGWVAQNHSGITYETLGINGAKASQILDWNQSILAGEMAARDPALIVVAYGTNEALSPGWTDADYRSAFSEVIHRLRADAPVASILVVGPPDCLHRYKGNRLPFPHLDAVIEIQRQVALENGCAFWDWRMRMGGPGSVRQWVQAGLSQGDYVHFTGAGYRLVADMLIEELMDQYNRFLAVRAEATNGQ